MNIENPIANALNGGGSTLRISALTATDGHVLTVQADGTFATEAPGASGVGGSTGSTDNALLRADGPGGSTVQSSAVTIDDSGNMSGVAALSTTTIELGHASDTTLSRSAAGVVAVEGVALIRGSTGSTDNALVRADGTGASTAQGSTLYVADNSDIVGTMSNGLWSTAVANTIYTLASVDGESVLEVAYVLTRTSGGSGVRSGMWRLHLYRTGGTWSVVATAETAITSSYAPTQAWDVSGNSLRWTITSTTSAGEIAWHVREWRYQGNLRDGS